MRGQDGGAGAVDIGHIDGDELHLLGDEVLGGIEGQARSLAEILHRVGVLVVPAGVDGDHIALTNLAGGLQVVRGDLVPVALVAQIEDHAVAEVVVNAQMLQIVAVAVHVDRRDQMGAGMEVGADLERLHAELGMLHAVVEDNVRVAGVRGNASAPLMGHFVEHKAAVRVRHGSDIGIGDLIVVFVGIEFVKIRWQHKTDSSCFFILPVCVSYNAVGTETNTNLTVIL